MNKTAKIKLKCVARNKSKLFPLFWFGAAAVTIEPNIYVNKFYFKSLSKIQKEALYVHENVHCKQQQNYSSKFTWIFRYIQSKQFRLEQELEAYKAEREFYKKHNLNYSIENIAKSLSSGSYFYMCSFEKAMTKMKTWDD